MTVHRIVLPWYWMPRYLPVYLDHQKDRGTPPRRSASIVVTGPGSPDHRDMGGSAKIARSLGASSGQPRRSVTC
jgi:hypothetical protein